jgi:cytochrome c oxidase subunit 3
MEKPWVAAAEGGGVELQGGATFALPTAKVGLRVLLAAISVLFSLLAIAYADHLELANWRPMPKPWLLWLNTGLLVASSGALEWARMSADRRRMDGVTIGLLAGGGCAFAFLIGQLLVWQQLVALGYFAGANQANAFFYLISGLHGLHLLGGLVAWARTMVKVRRGVEVERLGLSVDLCAAYWHFLLVVWLVFFGLLLFT